MSFLERVCAALRAAGASYAVAGAYAVALHGAVRRTADVDVVLHWTRRTLARTAAALIGIGLASRLPVGARDVFEFRGAATPRLRLISLKVSEPLLAAFRAKARLHGVPCRTQIKNVMPAWLEES